MKLTLENIKIDNQHRIFDEKGNYRGEIIYSYIRGSQLYHTNIEGNDDEGNPISDIDEGGIFIMPNETRLGIGIDYQNEIKDEKGDKCIWEIGRFMELALSSNPTVLEALFVPDDKVIYEHPVIKELRSHRNEFVSKECFAPFGGYAKSQILKCQGQNKMVHWDMEDMQRKTPMDFCYTFHNQGSMPMAKWLEERGLNQRNCGLVNIPNMHDVYGVYYDWGQHLRLEGIDNKTDFVLFLRANDSLRNYITSNLDGESLFSWYKKHSMPKGGYCGIISPDEDSNTIRFTSVEKEDMPICFMTYNDNAYQSHCTQYKRYNEWKTKRNKARYESNMEGEKSNNPDMKYDCKNIYHCFRLMAMAKEIAEGKGIILDRTGIDRDFLLEVRNRKYGYSELEKKMLKLNDEMNDAIKISKIKDKVDKTLINTLLINIRNNFK